jgi:hypothetical protein
MKKLVFTLLGIITVNTIAAQHIVTQMNIHFAEGGVKKYDKSQIDFVDFCQFVQDEEEYADSIKRVNEGNYNDESVWEQGFIYGGKGYPAENRFRTKQYLGDSIDIVIINENYSSYLCAYENDNWRGFWNGIEFVSKGFLHPHKINLKELRLSYPTYKFKIVALKSDDKPLSISDVCNNYSFFNYYYYFNVYVPKDQASRPQPILTFIDDDGYAEQPEHWKELYDSCGVTPSMAIITSKVGASNSITWETIDELSAIGFEFISHTHNHKNITTLSHDELVADLVNSKKMLIEHNCNDNLLVYPGNHHSEATDSVVRRLFKGAFWQGDYMNIPPLNKVAINRYSILNTSYKIEVKSPAGDTKSVYPLKSEKELRSIIDDTILRGGWTVFMCHLLNGYSAGYHYNDELRDRIISLCRYAKSKGVRIMTAGEALKEYTK